MYNVHSHTSFVYMCIMIITFPLPLLQYASHSFPVSVHRVYHLVHTPLLSLVTYIIPIYTRVDDTGEYLTAL